MGVGQLQWSTGTCRIHWGRLVCSNMIEWVAACVGAFFIIWYPWASLCMLSPRVPAIWQATMPPCPHLPIPSTMPFSSHLVPYSWNFNIIQYLFVTRIGPWVHTIGTNFAKEVVGLAHQLAVACTARCIPFYFFFASLILLRVNVEVTTSVQRLQDNVFASEIFHARVLGSKGPKGATCTSVYYL